MGTPLRPSKAPALPLLLPVFCLLLSLTGVRGQSCGFSQVDNDNCVCSAGYECGLPDPTVTISESCSTARICKVSTAASTPPPSADSCGYSIASQSSCACDTGYLCALTDPTQQFPGACETLVDICTSTSPSPSSGNESPPPVSEDYPPPPTRGSLSPLPSTNADTPPPLSLSALPPSSTDSPITGGTPPATRGLGSPPPFVAPSGVCGYSIPDASYCKCPDSYKCGLSSSGERISGLCTSVKCTKARCFAGSMTVAVEGKGRKAMSELVVGDRVMVLQRDGSVAYERVFAFSHRAEAEEMVTVLLRTKKGFSVEASLGHLLLTGDARARTAMRDVEVGDVVWVESADGGARLEADVVVARETRTAVGAYAPHTASGSIVVGGVAASCYTEHIAPHIAEMLLLPVRMLSGVLGDWAAHAANDAVLKMVAKA